MFLFQIVYRFHLSIQRRQSEIKSGRLEVKLDFPFLPAPPPPPPPPNFSFIRAVSFSICWQLRIDAALKNDSIISLEAYEARCHNTPTQWRGHHRTHAHSQSLGQVSGNHRQLFRPCWASISSPGSAFLLVSTKNTEQDVWSCL